MVANSRSIAVRNAAAALPLLLPPLDSAAVAAAV
eukprot:COSAG06_NODE_47891_length_336_cov_0.645570_2_plen_33_part_01